MINNLLKLTKVIIVFIMVVIKLVKNNRLARINYF